MYQFGRVTVSLECREVWVDGQPHHIGARAFEILELLVNASGRLVTKDEIMQVVWPNTIVVENNIQVHISALRKLFGGKHGWIRTESGRGYRLAPPSAGAVPERPAEQSDHAGATRAVAAQRVTPLIDREKEHGELLDLLERESLVTLVGPGGVGKTHLALEVVKAWSAARGIDLCRIDLANEQDDMALSDIVLRELERLRGADLDRSDAARAVAGHRMVLMFDNGELRVDELADLCETIAGSNSRAVLVVTSREPLRVGCERIYRVAPLDVPDPGVCEQDILSCGAVRLFLSRGRAMGMNLPADAKTLAAIAAVCRRLSGLPLALELAVARAASLGIQGLVADLDRSMLSLSGGLRTAHPRQHTLRATIDWSYNLLGDAERTVLARLAAFPGVFRLDAACALAACDELGPERVLDCMVSLASKSLLVVHSAGLSKRYSLLDVVRAYALEKLAESGELDRIREVFASYATGEVLQAPVASAALTAAVRPAPEPASSARPASVMRRSSRDAVARIDITGASLL